MNYQASKRLYRKVIGKEIDIHHACEIGVFLPETSNIIDFIYDYWVEKVMLVEPNPRVVKKIKAYFKGRKKITLYPIAIHEYNGTLDLFEAEASTFADGLPSSPALINDLYDKTDTKKITIECKLFSEIDPGDIDLLSIDTEGCEWYAIKTMVSRPKVISVETHGKFYVNPYLKEIRGWMKENGYRIWYKTKSDTVFYQETALKTSTGEQFMLMLMNIYIAFRKAKQVVYFKRYFRKKT